MSKTGKSSPSRLPLRVVLVLAICACGLAVHVFAEGLSLLPSQVVFEVTQHSEQPHPVHEQCDDDFIVPSLSSDHYERLLTPMAWLVKMLSTSVSISPLISSPNL